MSYTSTDLVADVRVMARLSDSDAEWTEQYILNVATREHRASVAPWLIGLKENFFVRPIDSEIKAGRARYPISSRSLGGTLRDLKTVDASGDEKNLAQKDLNDVNSGASGTPSGFTVQGASIVLTPSPSSNGLKLRQYVRLRCNRLVSEKRGALITGIDRSTKQITVQYGSEVSETAFHNKKIDIIGAQSPSEFIAFDVPVTASLNVLTLPEIPDDLELGDVVHVSGESSLVQLPDEVGDLLVLCVVMIYFESMNYVSELTNAAGKLEKKKAELAPILTNRIEGAPREVISIL